MTCVRISIAEELFTNQRRTHGFPATMPAIARVAVTVSDLNASREWYTRLLGVKPVLDEEPKP
jgi:hypothetical protein